MQEGTGSQGEIAKAAASSSAQPQDVPPQLLAQDFGVTRDCFQPPPSTPAACLPYTGTGFGIFLALDWEKAPDRALVGHQHGQKPHLDAWKKPGGLQPPRGQTPSFAYEEPAGASVAQGSSIQAASFSYSSLPLPLGWGTGAFFSSLRAAEQPPAPQL